MGAYAELLIDIVPGLLIILVPSALCLIAMIIKGEW